MQTIMDAASHIAEEIERTRLHLANLEQALAALRPLMTIDVSSTTLLYNQAEETQSVEDAFIVQKDKTKSKPHNAHPAQADTAAASAPASGAKPKAPHKSKAGVAAKQTPKGKSSEQTLAPMNAADEPEPAAVAQVTAASAADSTADTVEPQQTNPASLPATGANLWLKVAGRKAFSASELTDAALKTLSLDTRARAVMANRARAWITAALKKGVLTDAGMRNGTHFYKLA